MPRWLTSAKLNPTSAYYGSWVSSRLGRLQVGRLNSLSGLVEDNVYPIIRGIEAVRWEGAGASIDVNAIGSGGRGQRSIGQCGGKIIGIGRIEPVGVVGSRISRPRGESHRGEVNLLPTTGGFTGKHRGSE